MTTPVSTRSTSAHMASASGLFQAIQSKASFLCVGLDPDPAKIPAAFGNGVAAMEAFCEAVVEATQVELLSCASFLHVFVVLQF